MMLRMWQAWKDKYVANFISLSGNYGGNTTFSPALIAMLLLVFAAGEIDLFDDVTDTSKSGVDPLAR